jgi:hypothetical protein
VRRLATRRMGRPRLAASVGLMMIVPLALASAATPNASVPQLSVRPKLGGPRTTFVATFRVPRTVHTWDDFSRELDGPGGRNGCRGRFRTTGDAPWYLDRRVVHRVTYSPAQSQERWSRTTWCPGRFHATLSVYYLRRGVPGCHRGTSVDRCYRHETIGDLWFRVRRPG